MSTELKPSNGGLLQKGMDILKDPETTTMAKVGAVGIVAIGAIAFVAKTTIDAMMK